MLRTTLSAAAALTIAAVPLAAQTHSQGHGDSHQQMPAGATVPLYDNLGNLHHGISTSVPLAQRYFDQGLRLTYGFNHAEAIAAYRQASELDPDCAMCWWGIAWALGPNINASMDSANGVAAYQAVEQALARIRHATPREAAYIRALALRYQPVPSASRAPLDSAYARAMGEVADRFPADPDAQVLHAEALMLLRPWDYWTEEAEPRPGTERLLDRLTSVIERVPDHPGACHFYIHAVEAAHPERALACAERLPQLMPGAGHVVHMPAHIYIRVGLYAKAIETNVHAVHADEQYIADRRPEGLYPMAYYPHNYHFLEFAAQMAGQERTALEAARKLAEKVDIEAMSQPGLETLQHFYVAPLRAMVRFGKWQQILTESQPPADLPYAKGTWHWARGLALVRLGDSAAARVELEKLRQSAADPAVTRLVIWNINPAERVLQIAAHMLAGELAAAAGEYDRALEELREATRLEDGLTYDEPPTWEIPMRHFVGATLLDAGRPAEAEAVYRKDLRRFPDNGWALYGLSVALAAQDRAQEAARIKDEFEQAWRTADVMLSASRF